MIDIASAVSALIPNADTARFAIAVSGGADSMALLLMMAEAYPGCITALTVDHQLRAESNAEALQVATWCAALHVPHHILTWQQPATRGNIQAQARAARYDLLRRWCEANDRPYVLVAHNRDDVAETLLMRLARGAGVRGLSAMQARRILSPRLTLLRPLLDVPHSALVAALEARGQSWIEDPSNQSLAFERIRMRQWLAQTDLLSPERLATSAQALARADAALNWAAQRCFAEQAEVAAAVVTFRSRHDFLALPHEISRRLLLQAMELARGPALPPRQEEMKRLHQMLASPKWQGCTLGKCVFAAAGDGFKVKSEG